METQPEMPLRGGCGCGAVRFEVTAPLESSKYCHCTRCQRRTGTAASVSARPQPGSFRIVSGEERHFPVNLPNTGQVANLEHGPVVECMGVVNAAGIAPRDRVEVTSILGECLRRTVYSQELTVEAALRGDRTLVLEAMLSDQMAGRLPYDAIVAITDELLEATAPWLPQFAG